MAKVYAVLSGKGGVGKTTSTINIGTSLTQLGNDVTIVDGNITTPNIGIHLGAPIVPITLNHVLNGQAKLEDAIYEHESGTKIIPSSLSLRDAEQIPYKKLPEIMKKLKKMTEHVLIDSPAGLGEEARAVIHAADELIIITNPEMSAVTDALKTIKLAEEMKKPIIGVIITRHQGSSIDMSITNIKDMLEVPILGIIPEEQSIRESQAIKNAVIITHPYSIAAQTYRDATKRILGETVPFAPLHLGMVGKFLRSLGLR
jgi:septum site-determining protein MinD